MSDEADITPEEQEEEDRLRAIGNAALLLMTEAVDEDAWAMLQLLGAMTETILSDFFDEDDRASATASFITLLTERLKP